MSKFGILIAPSTKQIDRKGHMLLNSDEPQFKYYESILVPSTIPTTGAGLSSTLTRITIIHGLGYAPSYRSFLYGHTWDAAGRWGRIAKGVQQPGFTAWPSFPYSGVENIDTDKYTLDLTFTNSTTSSIASHPVSVRLVLFYDEMN